MRSIYDKNCASYLVDTDIEITEGNFFHLSRVCRVRPNETSLILDGLGLVLECRVVSVGKNSLILKIIKKTLNEKKYQIDLLLGIPKKDYFEDCLRISTEIGIRNIIPFKSHFSQQFDISAERSSRVLESSLIQSNNPYMPIIFEPLMINEIENLTLNYNTTWTACNDYSSKVQSKNDQLSLPQLLIIGPEGGFSKEEINFFSETIKSNFISLPSPILKSSTAIAAIAGCLINKG